MRRPALVVLGVGMLTLLLGAALLWWSVAAYLGSPEPLNSNTGFVVFTVDGQLVQYRPWQSGPELTLIQGGILIVAASLVVGAATWRPRVY